MLRGKEGFIKEGKREVKENGDRDEGNFNLTGFGYNTCADEEPDFVFN